MKGYRHKLLFLLMIFLLILWYNVITAIQLCMIFDLITERNAKGKQIGWLPTRDFVGQMSGRRRSITENNRIELIEEYFLIMFKPTSLPRWGAFQRLFNYYPILGPTLHWFCATLDKKNSAAWQTEISLTLEISVGPTKWSDLNTGDPRSVCYMGRSWDYRGRLISERCHCSALHYIGLRDI